MVKPGWKKVKFGDIVRNVNLVERNPQGAGIERIVGLEHIDPENLHICRWDSPENGTSFNRKFIPGQTLFGKRRAYQRKVAFAEFEGICSGDILTFEPKDPTILLPELLPFICQSDSFYDHALGTSAGSLSPRTSWSSLKDFEFFMPAIEEQKCLAEILWMTDEVIEKYQDSINNNIALKQACLNELGTISDNAFPVCQLGGLLMYASDGPFGSKLKTEHYSISGARVVRLQNICAGYYNDSDRAFISNEYYAELQRYALSPGDILVAGLGDESHPVGRSCIFTEDLVPAINKADCFCLRPNQNMILPEYLCYYLNSRQASQEIKRVTQGTTRYRINVSNLKSIKVIAPPLESQHIFVAKLKAIDDSINGTSGHIKKLYDLQKNLRSNLIL